MNGEHKPTAPLQGDGSQAPVDTSWGAVIRAAMPQLIWRGVVTLAVITLAALLLTTTWVVICELSNLGDGFGVGVTEWVEGASINPNDKLGFTKFLKLVLSTGFVAAALYVLYQVKGKH